MEISVNAQWLAFGIMLLGGGASGMLADLFMQVRTAFGFKRITTNLADLLLWALLAAGIFALNLRVNDGALRWYCFFALVLGAVLYYLTISRIVRVVWGFILNVFKKILWIILKIVLTTLGFLYKILNSVMLFFKHMLAPLGKGARRAGHFAQRRWHGLWLVLRRK